MSDLENLADLSDLDEQSIDDLGRAHQLHGKQARISPAHENGL